MPLMCLLFSGFSVNAYIPQRVLSGLAKEEERGTGVVLAEGSNSERPVEYCAFLVPHAIDPVPIHWDECGYLKLSI